MLCGFHSSDRLLTTLWFPPIRNSFLINLHLALNTFMIFIGLLIVVQKAVATFSPVFA